MPNNFKPAVVRNIGTTPVTVYTAPASTQSVAFSQIYANTTVNPVTLDIWTVIGGNITYLGRSIPIPAGGALLIPKVALEAGGAIRAQSSTANSVDATISVLETEVSGGSGPPSEALSIAMLPATSITQTSAVLSMAVTGTVPAGSSMLIQWSTSLSGPWSESSRPPAVAGIFSHTVPSGLSAGLTYYMRGFVFTDNPDPAEDVIHAVTALATFQTQPSTSGVLTLPQAYATAMTSLNDFPPGNSAGDSDFNNSLWPRSSNFLVSPYGANVDPIKNGQNEPGVGVTDPGYIVQRRAASSRIGDRFGLWQWIMGPKGILNALGNWRVEVRDVQAALKIDALSNAWRSKFSGQVRTYGPNGANPLMISGLLDDFMNTNGRALFSAINLVDGRIEASGGVSFKNFSNTTADFQVELNSNDPLVNLAADETPSRVVAFAALYWARIIPDTGLGPIPTGLRIGAMHGVDFFDGSGRVGTPGQSRLIELDANWRPVLTAYVLQGPPPSQPMTPADTATWLVNNPPPFV